jgi:hypothetical protein
VYRLELLDRSSEGALENEPENTGRSANGGLKGVESLGGVPLGFLGGRIMRGRPRPASRVAGGGTTTGGRASLRGTVGRPVGRPPREWSFATRETPRAAGLWATGVVEFSRGVGVGSRSTEEEEEEGEGRGRIAGASMIIAPESVWSLPARCQGGDNIGLVRDVGGDVPLGSASPTTSLVGDCGWCSWGRVRRPSGVGGSEMVMIPSNV